MGLLRISGLAVVLMAVLAAPVADAMPLLTGSEMGTNGTIGAGGIYGIGGTAQFNLGSEDSPENRFGDLHVSFNQQLSPEDPSVANGPEKSAVTWAGGFSIGLFPKASFGIDLDSLSDPSEALSTDGMKLVLGYDPIHLSYRYARTVVRADFSLPPKNTVFNGSFIYQHGLELTGDITLSKKVTLTLAGAYAWYSPDANNFANLLNKPALVKLSNLQDTLQSFELWSVGPSVKVDWSDRWDSSGGVRLAHTIIQKYPLIEVTASGGFKISRQFHVQVGWDYNHDPSSSQSTYSLELKWSWEREKPEAPAEEAEE